MKIFISWSGDRSKVVAEALRSWIPDVIHAAKPWVSGVDIRAGMRWSREVEEQLQDTQFGILCITKENQIAPWLIFEAGALAKSVEGASVCPYLIDLSPSELQNGPLTAFQAKRATSEDTFDMMVAINAALPEMDRRADGQLQKAFTRWWPDLEAVLRSVPPMTEGVKERSPADVADELLVSTRQLSRQMAEALAILAGSGMTPRTSARNIHHIRIGGDPAKIDELLAELQRGEHGVRVVQSQRYSPTTAAVNVGSDVPGSALDTERLIRRAGELELAVKVEFISP
jgi:hypothetical protein